MVVKNKDYLNWRYTAVPDRNYSIYIAEEASEIYGYLVLRCMQRQQTKAGVIFDILDQSENVAQCLISKAVERCKQEKMDLIYGSMLANKTLLNAFRKNGFISVPFIERGRFCAYLSSPHISRESLAKRENWFVQIGDSDAT